MPGALGMKADAEGGQHGGGAPGDKAVTGLGKHAAGDDEDGKEVRHQAAGVPVSHKGQRKNDQMNGRKDDGAGRGPILL